MAGLAEFRQKYPQYDDVPDVDLATKLHTKFYSDIPKAVYFDKLGLSAGPPMPPARPGYEVAAAGTARAIQDTAATGLRSLGRLTGSEALTGAGQRLGASVDTEIPLSEADQQRIPAQAGGAVGSIVATVPAIVAGGVVGGAAQMGLVGGEEQAEAAEKAGASPENVAKSYAAGGVTSAALGALPLHMILKPIEAAGPGWTSWATAKLKQAAQSGFTFATVGEAQQYVSGEIAREFYDPNAQDYTPDAKRIIANLAAGAVIGPTASLVTRAPTETSSQADLDAFHGRARGFQTRAEIDDFIRSRDAGQGARAETPAIPPGGAAATEPAPAAPPVTVPSQGEQTGTRTLNSSVQAQEPPSRATLEDMLNDPRSAAEIRADLEAQKKAVAEWQPSPDWQEIPAPIAAQVQALPAGPLGPALEFKSEGGKTFARIPPAPGTRDAPVPIETPADVHAGGALTATPTPAQAEAGNYQKRHVQWAGHDIAIETEAGGVRTGVGPDGKPWSVTLPHPYGYIKRTKGADGDQIDITLGPQPQAPRVFVVDQIDPATGKFDEHKNFAGFPDEASAVTAYQASFSDGSGLARMGAVSSMSVGEFTQWVKDGNTKKALAYEPAPVLKNVPAQPKGPQNLLQFLAAKGGLRLDPGGDLRSLGIGPQTRIVVPGLGFRNLVRQNGLDLDKAREAAVEAGYLHDPGWETDRQATTTEADILHLIAEGLAGRHTFTREGHADMAKREQARQDELAQERHDDTTGSIKDSLKEHGLLATDEQIREAADLALRQGGDPADAIDHVLERDALAVVDEGAQIIESHREEQPPDVPQAIAAAAAGEGAAGPANVDEPARPGPAQDEAPPSRVEPDQTGEQQPATGEREPAGRAEPAGLIERIAGPEGDGTEVLIVKNSNSMTFNAVLRDIDSQNTISAKVKIGSLARAREIAREMLEGPKPKAATEATPAGEQAVIPGAEKIGQGEQAQRKADEPLKPVVAQKPPDQGLFGDGSKQTDLIDQIPKAPEAGPSSFEFPKSMTTASLLQLRLRIDSTGLDRGAVSKWLEDQYAGFEKEGARIAEACLEQGGGYSIR